MDNRQAQIRERAGLEEGRLNEDFIEFLRTYGVWMLLIAAVVGGGTSVKRWWTVQQAAKVDNAFEELEAATASGDAASPESVAAVAGTAGTVRSVGALARLDAADLYLSAVRRGVKADSKVDATGKLENADDVLNADVRKDYLSKAADLYQQVLTETRTDAGRRLLTVGAMFGLAAVAESNRDFDKAKDVYGQIEQLVSGTPYQIQGNVAKERAAKLQALAAVPALLPKAELPTIASPEPAPAAPGAAESPTPLAAPAPAPAPAPSPAPTQPK
jgi:hypothetical protein